MLCQPLLLPSVLPSIRIFSNESALHVRWSKYWSFSISPSSEYSGLISFRIDWLDLLVVQGRIRTIGERLLSATPLAQLSWDLIQPFLSRCISFFPWPPRELGSACDLCLEGRFLVQYAFNASSPMPCGPSGHWSPREAEGKPGWGLFCRLGMQRTLSM